MRNSVILIGTLMVTCLTMTTSALADPPARVGRLAYKEGDVYQQAGDTDEASAFLNTPVTSGVSLWTDPNARAEIQVGALSVRMDHQTDLEFTALDDRSTQLHLYQGTVSINLRAPLAHGVIVDTDVGSVRIQEPGRYDIHADDHDNRAAPPAQLDVLSGQADIYGGSAHYLVTAGQAALFRTNPFYFTAQATNPGEFDDWVQGRDEREQAAHTAQYVSPEITGYEDLDQYGSWENDAEYGPLWYPQYAAADWAPYRYGHWASVAPWGWTWIDDAPWGFAPFHYGRWVHHHHRWAWYPGSRTARPVYAPALVTFVNGDFNRGRGHGIGWVPLAPNEAFHPYYNASDRYRSNINGGATSNTILSIQRRNGDDTPGQPRNRRGVTAVSSAEFTRGDHVRNIAPALPATTAGVAIVATVAIPALQSLDINTVRPAVNVEAGDHGQTRGASPHDHHHGSQQPAQTGRLHLPGAIEGVAGRTPVAAVAPAAVLPDTVTPATASPGENHNDRFRHHDAQASATVAPANVTPSASTDIVTPVTISAQPQPDAPATAVPADTAPTAAHDRRHHGNGPAHNTPAAGVPSATNTTVPATDVAPAPIAPATVAPTPHNAQENKESSVAAPVFTTESTPAAVAEPAPAPISPAATAPSGNKHHHTDHKASKRTVAVPTESSPSPAPEAPAAAPTPTAATRDWHHGQHDGD